jgi:hypothetical protein
MTGALRAGEAAKAGTLDGEPPARHVPSRPAVAEPSAVTATRQRWQFWLPVSIVVVGLLVTGTLALVSQALYTNNEKRLLDLRVREVGAVLAESLPNIQTPLAGAAALADATNGDVNKFMRFAAPYAGASPGHQFVSISLWRLGAPQRARWRWWAFRRR